MGKLISTKPLTLKEVKINDDFWGRYMKLVREEVIPYQWEALNDRVPNTEPSHAIENFRIAAGLSRGEHYGFCYQDSDVAKWLESVAYRLTTHPDAGLEKIADDVIDLLEKAQQQDGYLNTYYTITSPESRWTDERRKHELYNAGHLMEAAVAYYEATGKRRFLDIMCRFADYIDTVFGPEPEKKKGYPGHQGIELALVKMYNTTGEERYLKLSKFFIDERGKQPHFYDMEAKARGEEGHEDYFGEYVYKYTQAHKPVREQTEAVGHAVRAMYLYSGMADVAAETGDITLKEACRRLWDNVTKRQMYITAGVGSQDYGEDFTFDYDLPNDTMYNETCASIGLVFFAHRMLAMETEAVYADVMERALYNSVLSGMSLDGKKFFYVNPMEVWPKSCEARFDKKHVKTVRQPWFDCACCPPNIARLIASLGKYIYSKSDDGLYVHLYAGNETETSVNGRKVLIEQRTAYPWKETVTITVDPEEDFSFSLWLRIPGWCRNASLKVNGEEVKLEGVMARGYAKVERRWTKGDTLVLTLPMPVERIKANPEVRVNGGRIAIQRGPVVYCLEEQDNGANLWDIALSKESSLQARFDQELFGGTVVVEGEALRSESGGWQDRLYMPADYRQVPAAIKAIPYSLWCNRKPGEMLVWIRES